MDARTYLKAYVEQIGGVGKAAEKLGIPYSTLAGVCNGSRGVGHKLARRMADADPLLDASRLIWIKADKPAADPKAA
jgi:plasmid maintenance system antidote protein VapI